MRHRTWSSARGADQWSSQALQGAGRERQQGTLARQRPDNETEERNSGHVGAGRCCHAWCGCGEPAAAARGEARRGARHHDHRLRCGSRRRWRAGRPASRQLDRRAASTSATTPRSTSWPAARASRPGSSTVPRSSSRPTPTAPSTPTRAGSSCAAAGASCGWATRTARSTTASIGGQTIAAGTGGIDGSRLRRSPAIAGEGVFLTKTNDATKIRYYTPSFGGFSLGVQLHADASRTSTAAPTTASSSPRKNGGRRSAMAGAKNIVEGAAGL